MLVIGDVDSALGLQIEAKEQNPSNANVRGILAKILQVKGEYQKALEEIAIAKRLSPKGMSMSYFLTWEASIHQSMGNFKTAVATAESAMLLSPVNTGAQYIKIISSLALGNDVVAEAAVQALRSSTPEGIRLLVLFADVFPASVADKITLIDGRSFAGMSYQQGLDAILAQFGWVIDRS
jgi:protein involved in temperature-dependent protein secretion